MYNIPSTFFSMFKRYMGQICMNMVRSGKVHFLKNWNDKGNRCIQNTGKYSVNKLDKVAYKILKCPPTGYTSHTWRQSATTNLADADISFINLKHHGQWISDSVVEGYIANSRPPKIKRLHCLMPKGASTEMLGQHQDTCQQICSKNQHMELRVMVDLSKSNPPQESDNLEDGGLTLLGFSQIYDPAYEISDTTNDCTSILMATLNQVSKNTIKKQ